MADLLLVCEGPRDVEVVRPVFARVLPSAAIVVEWAGGERAAGAVAQYVGRRDKKVASYVCDRDYRTSADVAAALVDKTPCFFWRRHCIENYLLQPRVVVAALTALRERLARSKGSPAALAEALPKDGSAVAAVLRIGAAALAPAEAARMTLARLWERLAESAGRVQKRLLALPSTCGPEEGLRELLNEGQRLRRMAAETVAAPHLEPPELENLYRGIYGRVTGHSYMEELHFLAEFNGKTLCDQFYEWLRGQGLNKMAKDDWIERLVEAVVSSYAADRSLFGTDDFLDMANGVRARDNLPPLS